MKKIKNIILTIFVWIAIIAIVTFFEIVLHMPDSPLAGLSILLALAGGDLTFYIWRIKKYTYEKDK
jgi:hypothetical protein